MVRIFLERPLISLYSVPQIAYVMKAFTYKMLVVFHQKDLSYRDSQGPKWMKFN